MKMSSNNEETKNVQETSPEMSPEEFKRILLNWYKKQGITSELRAHLRHQMVQTLQNTQLGRKISDIQPRVTPKTEVINLLISEFLLKYDYHYSLSVFSSEIPQGNILQTNPRFMINESKKDFKFPEQYVWYILEMLDFKRDSEQTQKVHDLYLKTPKECLLVCIINNLSSSYKDKVQTIVQESDNKEYFNKLEPSLKNISNVLTHFKIPQNILIDILEHIKELLSREKDRIKSEEAIKYNALHSQVEKEIHTREIEISQVVNDMENAFIKEKQLLFEDLKNEHDKLQLLKEKSDEKEREYDKKHILLSNKEQNMKVREVEIEKQLHILILETNENQRNTKMKKENKKTQTEARYLLRKVNQSENAVQCNIPPFTTEIPIYQLRNGRFYKILESENSELKAMNRELTSTNSILNKDLEIAMLTIKNLLTSTPIKPTIDSTYKQKLQFASQSTIHSNDKSSSEENSSTDCDLEEAKRRIKKLEEETRAADRNYKEFKQRHMQMAQQNICRKLKSSTASTSETSDRNY